MISTSRHLQYATGYIELGMLKQAAAELTAINPAEQATSEVISVRIDLHMHAKQWQQVVDLTQDLVRLKPGDDKGWISWAFALRELDLIEEARAVLLDAEPLHGKGSGLLHYNLACYACLLGKKAEAKKHLLVAFKMEKSWKQEALDDPDLHAMHSVIKTLK